MPAIPATTTPTPIPNDTVTARLGRRRRALLLPVRGAHGGCLARDRADRADHRAAKQGHRPGLPAGRGRQEPGVRRHAAVRYRQVLRLRSVRDRHARQRRRAVHLPGQQRRFMPAPCSARAINLAGDNAYANPGFDPSSCATPGCTNFNFNPRAASRPDRSEYVAGLYLSPFTGFNLVAQGRFDERDWTLRRQDTVDQCQLWTGLLPRSAYTLSRVRSGHAASSIPSRT